MRVLPTAQELARAPYERVLKLWEGLGYYSRARNLHRAARRISRIFEQQSLQKFAQLLELPGIGRYTAGAIASIAFGEPVAVVDGNVARVLTRIFGMAAPVDAAATQKRLWRLAGAILPRQNPGEFNQALMELGALVCRPVRPRCGICPMRRVCVAHARGLTGRIPRRACRRPKVAVTAEVALVRKGPALLLGRRPARPARGGLAGMWELPALDRRRYRPLRELVTVRHRMTNRRITLRVLECAPLRQRQCNGRWRWASREQLRALALPAAHRRALERLALA